VRIAPFGHTIECAEGQSILRAALSRGYYLRYGCRHGGCGTCKVLVTDGDIEDSGSSFALSPAERAAGWALVCSSLPLSDCVIDISAMNLTEEEFLAGDQVVKSFPGGHFSEYLRHAEKGRMVRVFGPLGSLRVRLSYRKILMIASGSGLAPLLSMVADLTQKKDRRPVTVFFGARTPEELYYLDRLNALCNLGQQVEFVPVVEEPDPAWTGETGHVTDVIDRRMGSLKGYDAYVCGPPSIVQAARDLVIQLGVREANVYFDAFVPTGVEPLQ
jgi:Na+-transporting NADH:ubiquinone oxidoreductase subunit NqrF